MFDYSAVSAWAAIIAALVAVYAIWAEGKRSRFAHGLDLLIRMRTEFDSELFLRKRGQVAKLLIRKRKNNKLTKEDESNLLMYGAELIDHFQAVGLLMRRGLFDNELVYSDYGSIVLVYWKCLNPMIERERSTDADVWDDAFWLHKKLHAIDRKYSKLGRAYQYPNEKDIAAYLAYELSRSAAGKSRYHFQSDM